MVPNRDGDDGREFLDPHKFVEEFCSGRGLVASDRVGTTEVERLCISSAQEARRLYKGVRDAQLSETEEEDESDSNSQYSSTHPSTRSATGDLTPQQKYQRRLRNNRKSAAATKVFNEVLRRELSTVLKMREFVNPQNFIQVCRRIETLQETRDRLMLENQDLKATLDVESKKITGLVLEFRRVKDSQGETGHHVRALKTLVGGLQEGMHSSEAMDLDTSHQCTFLQHGP